jgi:hypothetical protein
MVTSLATSTSPILYMCWCSFKWFSNVGLLDFLKYHFFGFCDIFLKDHLAFAIFS